MSITWGIVLAAGSGTRFGAAKQFVKLGDRRLVDYSVSLVREVCDHTCLVLPNGSTWDGQKIDLLVDGGDTHAQSTRNAVDALPDNVDTVFITAASHPLVTPALARSVVNALDDGFDASAPLLYLADAVKILDKQSRVRSPAETNLLHTAQLPFAIRRSVLSEAIRRAPEFREELQAVEAIGGSIAAVNGDPYNIHVATRDDLALAEAIIAMRQKNN